MNRLFLYTVIILLLPETICAFSKTDSLKLLLSKTQDDKEYITLLNEISSSLIYKDNIQALDYAVKAEKLSETNKNIHGLINAYLNIGAIYEDKSNHELALQYYTKSMRISENSGNAKELAISLNNIGSIYRKQRKFNEALLFHNRSLKYLKEINDSLDMAITSNNLGLIYYEQAKFDKALLHFYNSLRINESLNNKKGIANSYQNIGQLYKQIKNNEQAKQNLKQSLELFTQLNHQSGIAQSLLLLGEINIDFKNYPDAIDAFNKCLNIYKERGDIKGMADAHLQLGNIYYYLGKQHLAENDFAKSLELYEKIENTRGIINTKLELAQHALNSNNYSKAYKLSESVSKISAQNKMTEEEYEALNFMALAALKLGNHKKAANLFYEAKIISDTLLNRKLINEVSQIQMQHEFEKLIQTHKYEENKLKLQQQERVSYLNRVRNILIVFSVIVSILVIITIREHRVQVNKNKLLSKEKERNKQNLKLLAKQKEELTNANKTKDKFLSIIGHDLRNPFNAISNFATLLNTDSGTLDDDEVKEYIQIIKDASTNATHLLDNMLEWGLSQSDNFKIKPESFNINDIINGNIMLIKEQLRQKRINLTEDLDGIHYIKADKNMLNTIIRNILGNAVKFTHNEGSVTIRTKNNETSVTIEIEDSGVGMSEEKIESILNKDFNNAENIGSVSNGLGLILCVDFLKKHNHELHIKSQINRGSKFWFNVDKA